MNSRFKPIFLRKDFKKFSYNLDIQTLQDVKKLIHICDKIKWLFLFNSFIVAVWNKQSTDSNAVRFDKLWTSR